jgi:hypothetical protein
MRNVTWIIAAGLAASTTGCVDLNSPYGGGSGYGYAPGGYSSGYSQGYAPAYSSGYGYNSAPTYYRSAPVNNYYVQPPARPQVITNTRYVPVPVPTDRRWNNNDNNSNNGPDRHWDNNNHGQAQGGQSGDHRPQQHDWHPAGGQQGGGQQAGNQPTPHAPPAATPQQQPRQHGSSQDRDGDGKPDRH